MKKVLLLLCSTFLFFLISCNKEKDDLIVGYHLNSHIHIIVVDQDGNDLLDSDNPNSIKVDNIQVKYYNEAGDLFKGHYIYVDLKPDDPNFPGFIGQDYRDPALNPYVGYCYTVVPSVDNSNITWTAEFNRRWGGSGIWVINWGDGFGEDTIKYKMQKPGGKKRVVDKIWLNDVLVYEYGRTPFSIQIEGYVVIVKNIE